MNPVCVTKAERMKLDVERCHGEDTGEKPHSDNLLAQDRHSTYSSSSKSSGHSVFHHPSFGDLVRDQERDGGRDSEHCIRDKEREDDSRVRDREGLEKLLERWQEDLHDEQNLVFKKPKIEPSAGFQFSFDPESTEDISGDMNVDYQEARLLFGKWHPSGMNGKEQKKHAAKNEKELRDDNQKKDGVEEVVDQWLKKETSDMIGALGVSVDRHCSRRTTDLISQHAMSVKESEKMPMLQKLLDDHGDRATIVFINTKMSANIVSEFLDRSGYRVTTVQGAESQDLMEVNLEGFRTKRYNVLCATDALEHGMDIPDVAHVINYDMPNNISMYMHRIGHMARDGKTGFVTTFLTRHDSVVFYNLIHMLIHSNSIVPPQLACLDVSEFKAELHPYTVATRNDTIVFH